MALAISASTAAAADLSLPEYRHGNAHVMERSMTKYINLNKSNMYKMKKLYISCDKYETYCVS